MVVIVSPDHPVLQRFFTIFQDANEALKSVPSRAKWAKSRFAQKVILTFILLNLTFYVAYSYRSSINRSSSTKSSWSNSGASIPRPDATSTKVNEYVLQIRQFWEPWEQTIVAAKPNISKVELVETYGWESVPPDGWTQARPEPRRVIDLSEEDIGKLSAAHRIIRDKLDNYSYQQNSLFHGKGVVMTAGGRYLPPALVNLYMLRLSNSTLPVEIWFSNKEEYNEALCRRLLQNMNTRCLVLSDFLDKGPLAGISHYQLKVMALLFSSFQEVVSLDSDNMPIIDSAHLFESDAYNATGFLSWSDFWAGSESPDFYTIAGLEGFPGDLHYASAETGQLVIDKKRHMKSILLAAYYNIYGPDIYYTLQSQGGVGEGDKTTFTLAAIALNESWYRIPTPPERVWDDGGPDVSGTVQYIPSTFQTDLKPWRNVADDKTSLRPAFFHASRPKLNVGELAHDSDMMRNGHHVRIWKLDWAMRLFGEDVEKKVWGVAAKSACEFQDVIKIWRNNNWNDTCSWAIERKNALFG